MSGLAKLLIRMFFRQVEVEHRARLDSGRPTVAVADHRNGLVDGLLLMAALPRYPHFLGKSTLFHNPLLWPFLKLGGVVPVFRAQDGGSPEGNRRAFARCRRLLAAGGMVAIFPEGISHDLPGLQPLRTGAARIALEAAAAGLDEVETVTVTLVYDDKQQFRSRALVRVGAPAPVRPWSPEGEDDDAHAVRGLTADLTERLRRDGTEYASWADEAELAGIAEVMVRSTTVLPGEVTLEDRRRVAQRLADAALTPEGGAVLARAREAMATYQRRLDLLGLTDAQVAAEYGSGRSDGIWPGRWARLPVRFRWPPPGWSSTRCHTQSSSWRAVCRTTSGCGPRSRYWVPSSSTPACTWPSAWWWVPGSGRDGGSWPRWVRPRAATWPSVSPNGSAGSGGRWPATGPCGAGAPTWRRCGRSGRRWSTPVGP